MPRRLHRLRGAGADQEGLSLAGLAIRVFTSHDLPDGMEPSLDADATFDPVNFSFPHGTHLCAMEIDTETGESTMRSYVCVDDIGNVVNPLIVDGQVHGGLVQGIAQALWEEAVYDDQGTLVSGSFVDYTLPTSTFHFCVRRSGHAAGTLNGATPSRAGPRHELGTGQPRHHPQSAGRCRRMAGLGTQERHPLRHPQLHLVHAGRADAR